MVLEGQKSEFIGENRPKVGGRQLSIIVSFEEAVDASDAIRRGGCHDIKEAVAWVKKKVRQGRNKQEEEEEER